MRYDIAKKASQVKLQGVKVEFDTTGDTLNAVTLKDASGNLLRLSLRSYCLVAEIPAAPKMVKRHRVTGVVVGVKVCEDFDDKYAAAARADEIKSAGGEATAAEVEIPEPESLPATEPETPF